MITYDLVDNVRKESLPGLVNLYAEEFHGIWAEAGRGVSAPKLAGIMIKAGQFFIVAKRDGNPIGFVECGYRETKNKKKLIEIFAYYTTPSYRRSGLAKRLTAKVILKARKENLHVVTIPNPTDRVIGMVERFMRMQEKIPTERRAVRARINRKRKNVFFRIKRKRK